MAQRARALRRGADVGARRRPAAREPRVLPREPARVVVTAFVAWVVFPLALALLTGSLAILLDRDPAYQLPAALLCRPASARRSRSSARSTRSGSASGSRSCRSSLLGVAGIVLERATLRERWRDGRHALLVGAGSYALFLAPVVLAGGATFLGYNFLNDTSLHLIFIQYVADHGAVSTTLEPSSYASATVGHVANNYPFGAHELVATFDAAMPVGPEHLYQPFLAICAGVAAMAIYAFLTEAGAPRWAAAIGAPVPLLSQLLFSYQLQGGIKELALVAVLCTAAALGARLTAGRPALGHGILLGLAAAGAVGIYGVSAGAWLAPLALAIGGFALLAGGRATRRRLPIATLAAAWCSWSWPGRCCRRRRLRLLRPQLADVERRVRPAVGPAAQRPGRGDLVQRRLPLARRRLPARPPHEPRGRDGVPARRARFAFAIRRRLYAPIIFLASVALAWSSSRARRRPTSTRRCWRSSRRRSCCSPASASPRSGSGGCAGRRRSRRSRSCSRSATRTCSRTATPPWRRWTASRSSRRWATSSRARARCCSTSSRSTRSSSRARPSRSTPMRRGRRRRRRCYPRARHLRQGYPLDELQPAFIQNTR